MTNLEYRVFRLEKALRIAEQNIRDLQVQVGTVQQNAWAASPGSGGSGSSSVGPCVTTLGGTLAAASGTPGGPLTQAISQISGGAFVSVGSASVYNGLGNSIASGKNVLVQQNSDGTYTVIAVQC